MRSLLSPRVQAGCLSDWPAAAHLSPEDVGEKGFSRKGWPFTSLIPFVTSQLPPTLSDLSLAMLTIWNGCQGYFEFQSPKAILSVSVWFCCGGQSS